MDPSCDFKNLILNDTEENDSTPYHNVGHNCNYFEQDEFATKIKENIDNFSIFSQNIRSLTGKWTDFVEQVGALNYGKFKYSVICLQEIWNKPNGILYNLPGYKHFHFSIRDPSGLNNNSGGGVGLWVKEEFEFEPLD